MYVKHYGFLEYLYVPVNLLVDFVLEVTVTVVRQTTLAGVFVIVKLLTEVEELCVVVKKAAAPEPSSFFADTSIVTPCGGIVEVMVTLRGKSV